MTRTRGTKQPKKLGNIHAIPPYVELVKVWRDQQLIIRQQRSRLTIVDNKLSGIMNHNRMLARLCDERQDRIDSLLKSDSTWTYGLIAIGITLLTVGYLIGKLL